MEPRRHVLLLATLLAALLTACGTGLSVVGGPLPDAGATEDVFDGGVQPDKPATPDVPPVDAQPDADMGPAMPVAVETMAPTTVRAGDAIDVICNLLDAAGAVVPTPGGLTPTITFAPADAVQAMGGRTIAARVGDVAVTCAFPTLALTDATPATVRITPGAAARVVTTLDRTTMAAGETATATCAVTDAFGNAVTDAMPTLRLDPMGLGATITGLAAQVERAGTYAASCVVAGATGDGVTLTVTPSLPATLSIARSPDMPLYARGAAIEVRAIVADRFGNVIADPPLNYTSAPEATVASAPFFTYSREGRYTITVRVTGMTEGGVELTQSTSFVIDSSGPGIDCAGPAHGSMVNAAPGTALPFRVRLTDTSGVRGATINGAAVTVDGDGNATGTVTTRWGVNYVDVVSTDTNGQENSRTCAFLASDRWNAEASPFNGSVQLMLRQDAVDDGDPTDPVTSIDDVLQRVINSAGLRNQLHGSLLAANPLKDSCDQRVFGACVFRSSVNYENSELNGPNVTALSLVDGGLRATVHFENVRVRLRIGGTLSSSGWVTVRSLDVGLTIDLSLSGGRPHAAVRGGSVSTSVGRIDTDFSGLTGFLIDFIVSVANGTIRNTVSSQLQSYVTNNFASTLDGVFSGLDVSSLGATFDVPRLDRSGSTPLRFGVNISALSPSTARLLFGLGTLLSTSSPTNARPSLGIALPPNDSGEPAVTSPATVALHVAVLNQALHALWRGAWLDATLDATTLSSELPAGSNLRVTGLLPPVAHLRDDGRVNLDLGALEVAFVLPGGADPFQVSVGARASGAVTLMGDSLRFGSVTLDETHVSITSESISMAERAALSTAMNMLLQTYVTRSLNDALPTIPIPSFGIPSSLAAYGLPAGAQLGIRSPALTQARQRFELRGGFGQR